MTIQKKSIIITCFSLFFFILLMAVVSRILVLGKFADLEEQNVRTNIGRVLSSLDDKLATLESKAADYAAWDDTYNFVDDGNKEYITSNFTDEGFQRLNLNFLFVVDNSGKVIFSKGYDLEGLKESPVPESVTGHIKLSSPVLAHKNEESVISGYLVVPEGIIMFVSLPVVTSENKGPVKGSFIMARYLDKVTISEISEKTHLSLDAFVLDGKNLAEDCVKAQKKISVENPVCSMPLSKDTVAGYTIKNDIYGAQAFMIRINDTREIYGQGKSTLLYFTFFLLIMGLGLGIVFYFIIKGFIRPVREISAGLNDCLVQGYRYCGQTFRREPGTFGGSFRTGRDNRGDIDLSRRHLRNQP